MFNILNLAAFGKFFNGDVTIPALMFAATNDPAPLDAVSLRKTKSSANLVKPFTFSFPKIKFKFTNFWVKSYRSSCAMLSIFRIL